VQFKIDGVDLGTPVNLVNGAATLGPLSSLAVGSHVITASYSGDSYFNSAVGAAGQQVNGINMVVYLAEPPNPQYVNQNVIFPATVGLAGTAANQPNPPACPFGGNVTFKEGAQVLGIETLDSNCQAVLIYAWSMPGTHTIVAYYEGDATHATATSNQVAQLILARVFVPFVSVP
jgi:hypothetical protein